MVYATNHTVLPDVMELLSAHGFDEMGKAMEIIINGAMRLERARYLQAQPYERTDERQGHANGFKPKTMNTRIGSLHLEVPQTRDSQFYPKSLEKGLRSERALKSTLAEMYIQGVSTRKVAKITEELCGFEVTSTEVSRATALLDTELEAWRNRPLGCFPHIFLDARYEKIRHGGHVIDMAVLIAIGVSSDGKRQVLGVSVSLSEQEVHWRHFLQSLFARGLHGVLSITSDAHMGIRAALASVCPGIPWQRCQFHLQQNAQKYVPKQDLKEAAALAIRNIFNAPDKDMAEKLLKTTIDVWAEKAPKLSAWMEENIPEGFTVFCFSEGLRKKLRTSNPLERVNQEIKRRTRVARIFPNEISCLRLITAILMEISEDWETGKPYLKL